MFVPLKVTTDYSLLKSMIKIDDLINFLQTKNISACAICDEYLYGVVEFYDKCLKNNIKPIVGLDIQIQDCHLYLYAQNYAGYQNLLKLNTLKTTREIEIEDLSAWSNNIILVLPYASLELFPKLQNIYNQIYLGYQNAEEKQASLKLSSKVVYVQDVRALNSQDTNYLNYLNLIELDKKVTEMTFKDYSAYALVFPESSEAKTTEEFCNQIDFKIPKSENLIPKYDPNIEDSKTFLASLAHKGLNKRLKGEVPASYQKRLQYELDIINKMGFADYILIVYDYVLYAKKNGILVGPGRGSAAGSLVCYSLGITDIDPLEYNLLFERFLNPERVTMPDIDIDFENTKRNLVIDYIKKKYGEKNVAGIMTFATLKSKSILREIARVMNYSIPAFDNLIKIISSNLTLEENYENPEVQNLLNNNAELKKIYKIAYKLEGLKKNISTHAAGVVIASEPLDNLIPIDNNGGNPLTGVTKEYLEELGLLKMDLLAIKNLTIITNILDLIKKDTGKTLDLNKINLNDKDVINLFTKGDTTGIFQFESLGMRKFLQKLKPRNFNDIVASIALYRPGPMDNIDTFIRRKEKKEPIDYIIPVLEPILKETEGIIVYQEQVMQILSLIGSYSFAEADLVRRAMSKKKKEVMLEEKDKFISRAVKNGYEEKIATRIYDLILKFAAYGFNKSHSVAYALIGYQMAYLKVKFPKYFLTNLLNMSIGSENITEEYLTEAKKYDLIIEKPHLNLSHKDYYIQNNTIYLPFSIIKGLSEMTITSILKIREEHGPYLNFLDFLKRTYNQNLNERIIRLLINAEIFRDFANITTLQNNLEVCLNYAEVASLVDSPLILEPVIKEFPDEENKINLELESYGFYISNHPVTKYVRDGFVKMQDLAKNFDKYIKCVVLIESIKKTKTKLGEEMAFILGSDETGKGNFVIFAKQVKLIEDLKNSNIVEFQGRVTKRYDKYQINVNNIIKK